MKLIRRKKLVMFDKVHGQYWVYVDFEDVIFQTPKIISVQLAGDLLEVTDKLTDKERKSIQRRIS